MFEGEFIAVRTMLQAVSKEHDLRLVAGEAGLDNTFNTVELNRPGLAFAGFHEVFTSDRVQILGITEINYLKSLDPGERLKRIRRTFEFNIPCVVVTSDLDVPQEMTLAANERNIPVLRTTLLTSLFSAHLTEYLEHAVAPVWHVHGVAVDVFGMGVLITGQSGVGKSECALELIERGHRLIADDVVLLRRIGKDKLIGSCSPRNGYHMEIRGIGIIDIEQLFGVRSVRDQEAISLVIRMVRWVENREYDRIGITTQLATMFDCEIPEFTIPVQPGRNMSLLIEVAALTQRQKNAGINPAELFNKRLQEQLKKRSTGAA